MNDSATVYYEQQFLDLHERLIRILGVLTVNRLLHRACVEIGRAHPAVLKIRCDEDSISMDGLNDELAGASDEEIRETFQRLNAVLLLLVARLLGNEVARRLTEGVPSADRFDWRQTG